MKYLVLILAALFSATTHAFDNAMILEAGSCATYTVQSSGNEYVCAITVHGTVIGEEYMEAAAPAIHVEPFPGQYTGYVTQSAVLGCRVDDAVEVETDIWARTFQVAYETRFTSEANALAYIAGINAANSNLTGMWVHVTPNQSIMAEKVTLIDRQNMPAVGPPDLAITYVSANYSYTWQWDSLWCRMVYYNGQLEATEDSEILPRISLNLPVALTQKILSADYYVIPNQQLSSEDHWLYDFYGEVIFFSATEEGLDDILTALNAKAANVYITSGVTHHKFLFQEFDEYY